MNQLVLDEISSDGILSTNDGNKWEVNSGDNPTVIMWQPGAHLIVTDLGNNEEFHIQVTNMNAHVSVRAKPVER